MPDVFALQLELMVIQLTISSCHANTRELAVIPHEMRDLYQRLSKVGFDKEWVRAAILPDWWDDEMASVPYNRAAAEACISANLGFHIRQLRDRSASLPTPEITDICFKRNRKVAVAKVAPSIQVVRRAAKLVTSSVSFTNAFASGNSAADIRKELLNRGPFVTLSTLVDYCWEIGIAVIGVTSLPKKSAKFDGLAMYQGDVPAIVLASGKDGPPWLAFHLAHELGHLQLGHVKRGEAALLDDKLSNNVDDANEVMADELALELLTGKRKGINFRPSYVNAQTIGLAAEACSKKNLPNVEPGMIVMSYCKSTTFWPVAQGALEAIGLAKGGRQIIGERLGGRLIENDLSETELRFLTVICQMTSAFNRA
jgi:hypothetical protein